MFVFMMHKTRPSSQQRAVQSADAWNAKTEMALAVLAYNPPE